MSMTEALLHKRLAETPEMEPCDGVKLLYQSRFGCGHLLPPDGQLAERIRAEADETPASADLPPFSFIGNGLCRMNLAAPAVRALPPELRTPERLNQPGGNIHYERFLSEVLPGLIAGRAFSYGSFDCHHGVTRPVFLPQSPVRIAEGSYALHPRFEESYRAADALTVFLCVSPAEQLRRIEKRSPALLERFREVWIPLENSYFQAYDIQSRARIRLKSMPWEGDA